MPHPFSWRWSLTASLLLVGCAGVTAAWVAVAVLGRANGAWMALVAAANACALLRLSGAPSGWAAALLALAATTLVIVASQWLLVATRIGLQLGLGPIESATRLGPHLAWALASSDLRNQDWLMLALALLLAPAVGLGLGRMKSRRGP